MNGAQYTLSGRDIATLVAGSPLAEAWARGAAFLAARGDPVHIVYASSAAFAMMGATEPSALQDRLLGGESPGARRLRQLAQSMPAGTGPRLEQLRFFIDRIPRTLAMLCMRATGPDGAPLLIVASLAHATGEAPNVAAAPSVEPPRVQPVAPAPLPPPEAAATLRPSDGPVRFLWALDAEQRFREIDPKLVERLGAHAPQPGESLADAIARGGVEPESAWGEWLASHQTFTGLRLTWNEADAGRARVLRLSGAPQFGRDRAFEGYRGFGVFTGETAPANLRAPVTAFPVDNLPPQTETRAEAPAASSPEVDEERREDADIVPLRPGAETAPTNVIPIRPGALAPAVEEPAPPARERGDSVELTSQERDAFQEIARALGVRLGPSRRDRAETPASEGSRGLFTPGGADSPATPDAPAPSRAFEPPTPVDLARLVDALPIGALVLRDGKTLFVNRMLLDFAGFDSMEAFLVGDGLRRMFRGRDPEALARETGDMPIVASDGEILMVHSQCDTLPWGGAPATLISMRRSREAEYQEQIRTSDHEARTHAIRARALSGALDMAADGFLRLDPTGRLLGMSPRAEAVFGYDQKEAAGENFLILVAPADQAAATAAFEQAAHPDADETTPVRLDLIARDRSGRQFPARISFGALTRGQTPEFVALVQDRTEAAQREDAREAEREAASTANARKTEFLSQVSHEIRTPLHAILGFTEVMLEERFGPMGVERYKDYLKDIHASGQHLMSLTNDLLDLAKIEAGKMELQFAPVDVNKIIRDCVALMQPQAARERVIVRLSLYERLPHVMADERSLRQIMLNLMSNAVKYNEPGGQVIVSTALDEAGHSVIRVRDTGVGMNESELGLALEPFKRVGLRNGDEGTGLGLPLTKALVEANHADFSIKSRKDQGTLVEVAFPSLLAAQ